MSASPAPRDLVVSPYTPALGSGRALRTYGVVRALAAHRPVDLLYAVFGAAHPGPAYGALPAVRLHPVRASRGPARGAAYLRARARGVPPGFARGVSPELVRAAVRLAGLPERGRVIADGPVAAAAMLVLAARREVIYNAHNLESAFRGELAGARGQLDPRTLEPFERRLLDLASESWMPSPRDIEAAQALSPGARLRYVPNVVDVAAIAPVRRPRVERRALFVADFSYEPNRRGAAFLLDEVMPRVWAGVPDARLVVVGSGLRPPSDLDPRIEVLGFVGDLAPAYRGADCVVVPLLHGGGSPLKFIEALAYGLPVLGTPAATAGLEGEPGRHYLQAEGAEAFAAALADLLVSGGAEVGAAGRRLAEERYSIEALTEILAA